MSTHKMSDYWSLGTAIGLCAAIGVVVGALLGNVALWLGVGAGVGVVVGAISAGYQHTNRATRPQQRTRP